MRVFEERMETKEVTIWERREGFECIMRNEDKLACSRIKLSFVARSKWVHSVACRLFDKGFRHRYTNTK